MSIRPDILTFACAVQALWQQAKCENLNSDEAGTVSEYLERLEAALPLDGTLRDLP